MWVLTNGEYELDEKIRIYAYYPGRIGSFAVDFLQTDGYIGYEKVSCKEHSLCWVYARRYFIEAIPSGLSKGEIAETISGQALKRIHELFALDKASPSLTGSRKVCDLKKTSWRLCSRG